MPLYREATCARQVQQSLPPTAPPPPLPITVGANIRIRAHTTLALRCAGEALVCQSPRALNAQARRRLSFRDVLQARLGGASSRLRLPRACHTSATRLPRTYTTTRLPRRLAAVWQHAPRRVGTYMRVSAAPSKTCCLGARRVVSACPGLRCHRAQHPRLHTHAYTHTQVHAHTQNTHIHTWGTRG